ncbi:LOW QUALITY PROTEIN: WD repeat-containing protein 97 [Eumetopias jubatus]|uniref:LOW QUALITY PROTEIN: WD repeat-containing protein 97 n=1 Tax=Eumetopias jubatus TaxID=34886 RepID=UPI0010162018|nr:LOW QUALITY PROTEIN: WD repeat-containing protein 97 [Eumetopias jubatus]
METEDSDASNPYSVEGNKCLDPDVCDADSCDIPDPGLLKEKNGEVAWPRPQMPTWLQARLAQAGALSAATPHSLGSPLTRQGPPERACLQPPELGVQDHTVRVLLLLICRGAFGASPTAFTSSSRWQNMTPRARAHQLWLFLRAGLHDFVEKEKRGELCVARLTHGLEPLRHLKVAAGLCSVAQDPVGRRFVVLDGAGHLHVHREDGWAYEKLQAPAVLTGLVAVPGPLDAVSRFVGWGPKGLAILRPDLSLLWLSKPGVGRVPGHEPLCCLPVPSLGLLLVAGAGGSLVLWKFCSGGRRLVPCGSPLQLPPSPTGTLTRLVLGPLQSHQVPRCFAAYGSAVLTFDLHTWALVDVRRDLHKTAILDLAYCLEVEAMVTASRDSTVKVWEADWRIRMVFMGHTGPVTALAVLPNTSLVLSASQDGTLRTWDLQAAAQVGEVALNCWGPDVASGRVNRLLAPAGPSWPVLSLRASSVELWRLRELYSPLAQLSAPVLHVQVVPALSAPPHPLLPARLVCACADGSVYLVSVATGRTVSALLLEPGDCAASVLYCLPREALWLLTRTGQLVCASAARCPMRVLHRVCPPPAPAPRPCCLHLYSHLTDPGSAFAGWETVCQHGGESCRSDAARAWKDKNRYLPVVGHTDGTLSVLEWRWSKTVFQTEAHSPGPVTAIASTWNSIVSSGGDLTVKMWRVYPYAEESLSLLRTFSCGHPAVGLCALGKRITVGFEDPDSATYGLVQFGLGDSPRYDHRSQDDPTDHITGLCCCPTLKLYACSSLDCTVRIWTAENRLLRLLQLNGAPQGLTFSSNSGDLVLALGSRLCLVSHRLYLPTSYLVKKLCQKVPDVVDDPLLPLTSQESRTSAQLQRLANLHGVASLSTDWSFAHRQTATPQQPVLEEDLEALVARDQDLQQLSLGLVVPTAQPPPSQHERQEAFDHYLHLIYGPGLLDVPSGREFQRWSTVTLAVERETWDVCTSHRAANCLWKARVCPEVPTVPAALPQRDPGAVGPRFVHPPRAPLPIPPVHRGVHSKASQLLARSSLSSNLGLSLDLQLHLERLRGEKPVVPGPPALHLQHGDPLLMKRRPKEPLSNLRGFFPTTIQPYKDLQRPVSFPGSVPNSVVLQQMWLHREVSSLGALAQHTSRRSKPGRRQDDLWLPRRIGWRTARWQQKLTGWLGEEEEEEEGQRYVDWSSDTLSPPTQLSESEETEAQDSEYLTPKRAHSRTAARPETCFLHPGHPHGHSLWEERYGHLPRFLHFFVGQNWFKKLFPIFTLEAYPEVSTVEGLASLFVDLLYEASWADGVHILKALLRLLPDTSRDLRNQLQGVLVRLLNLDQPPSLEDQTQKQFVMLALQLLLAGSLQSREVVLELMSYFLYSPASRRPELRKLLDGLGLQDPQGFLFKEMMTWVQGPDAGSKAALRKCCCQKLEEMIQRLQETLSQISVLAGSPHVSRAPSVRSWVPSLVVSPGELNLAVLESGAKPMPSPTHLRRSKHALSEAPPHFCPSEVHAPSSAPAALLEESLPLAQTDWSQSQMLDLGPIDALNFFCEQQRARLEQGFPQEELETLRPSPRPPESNTVLPQPRDRWHYPILRLQEAKVQRSPMRLRGWMRSRLWVGHTLSGSIRMLKLPLPRVEVQPFPPDWPRPARPLPPRLLQPTLQRYFLPDYTETLTATADQTGGPSLFFPPAWSQDVALQPAVLPWK